MHDTELNNSLSNWLHAGPIRFVADLRRVCPAIVRLTLLSLVAVALIAQTFTASVSGTVKDPSGAIVPGATITLTNTATNAKSVATADGSGNFVVLQLAPGSYAASVSATGFKQFVQTGIILSVSQQARLDVSLAVGQLSDQVTVEADASALDTTSSTVGQVVDNRQILNLPLNTRNIYSLIYLTPGVGGSIGNNYNSLSYTIYGSRTGMMETIVDGVTGGHPTVQGYSGISVFPSVDAIGEFKVMGANLAAEYGRTHGSVVNIVYKSGTNTFHGSAYDFLRNSLMDANDYFANSKGQSLASFKRNQFGGVFNGPIRKNRTFFLVSLEDKRQRSFSNTTQTVPTALQRTGDFSQTYASSGKLITIFDPMTTRASGSSYIRDAFAGNVIPASRILTVSKNVLGYTPQANTQGNSITNAQNFYSQGSAQSDINSYDFRVDHNFNDRERVYARYSHRSTVDSPAVLLPSDITIAEGRIVEKNAMRNFVGDYTRTLSPSMILNGRLGFARSHYLYQNQGLGFKPSSLGLPAALDTAGYLPMFPVVSTSGFASLGNQDNRDNAFMTYTAVAALTKVHGRHTIKVGWEGRLIRVNNHEYRATSGNFAFTAGFTQGPNPNTASSTAGSGLASLLLGTGTGTVIQNFKDVAAQSYYHAWYIQDDIRVSDRLTLNLGLRYDLDTPRTERFNRMNYFDPSLASPLASAVSGLKGGLVFVGNGNSRYQYIWDRNNWAPRIGFAYRLGSKTVFRGGWGNIFGVSAQEAHGTVGPFGYRTQYNWTGSTDGITPTDLFSNPFPSGFGSPTGSSLGLLTQAGSNFQAPMRDTPTPYSPQWNLTVSRELPGQVLLEVGYIGTRGLQLMRNNESGLDVNQLDPKYMSLGSKLNETVANPFYGIVNSGIFTTQTISRMQSLRPYPLFTNIIPLYSAGSSSTYHGLQASFTKRYAHGFQLQGNYMWSKCIDNGMTHQNSYDIRASRAVSSTDVTHRMVVSYVYEMPFGHGRRFGHNAPKVIDTLLGGWQFNGITTLQSGTPLSITATNVAGIGNPAAFANSNGRNPNISGDIHGRLNRYFDTTVFSQPAAFSFGNLTPRVNSLRSPKTQNHDWSIFKDVALRERLRLQIRAEFLNAFNTVRFSSPNTSVASTSFGIVSSQDNSPRQTQLGLKLIF
jgi:hypothetical protein